MTFLRPEIFRSILLLSFIIMLSCSKKNECSIQDISRIESEVNKYIIGNLDTVENNLNLLVYFDLSCQKINNREFLNTLDYNSARIEFDKAFILQGDTIHSGTNLSKLEKEGIIRAKHIEPIEEYAVMYEFYEEFFLTAEFDSTPYEVTFEITTSDGIKMKASRNHYFK